MLGTFPMTFSQVETSQVIFPSVQFPKLRTPKSVLAATLGPLSSSSRNARPQPTPLQPATPKAKPNLWEVATCEIVTWEVVLG